MADPTSRESLRALVVDDDPVSRAFADEALSAMGFVSTEADSGAQALDVVDGLAPHLVLLDLRMPGMDGFETCARLREKPEFGAVPIIVATGMTDAATIERAFEAGATDFIKKPIDWKLFRHRVRFVMRAYGAFQDLHDTLTNLADSQERLADAQRIARLGHYELDLDSGAMTWSSELRRMLDVGPSDPASLEALLDMVPTNERGTLESSLRGLESSEGASPIEHKLRLASGTERIVWHHAELKGIPTDTAVHVRGSIQDITQRRRDEERIRYLAYYDPLTGVPNRNYLLEHLPRIVGRARNGVDSVALVCIDLDRFKRINDNLGCAVGDQLLGAVARRLRDCVRATDFVGRASDDEGVSRLGGDEFIVVLCGIRHDEGIRHAVRRLMRTFEDPFLVAEKTISISGSFGIAVAPGDASDAEVLLANAELAMSKAKAVGGGMHCFFDASMNETAQRRFELESDVRIALDRGEYRLAYQPLIDVRTQRIVAVEALLRWDHPTHGPISPGSFIPIAEELGLIVDVCRWTLVESCRQVKAWRDAGLSEIRVSVNMSPVVFRRSDLVETIIEVLAETGTPPGALEIEVTESALLGDEDRAVKVLERLREMGVRGSLDDFGTGYSSLTHLVHLPIDTLKIDRTFVKEIGPGSPSSSVVAGVIAMARHMGLDVVAEGVETARQEAFLRTEGCDILQGFRFSRALRPEAIERMLRCGAIYSEPGEE
jgi:diguanylate cyclase (GGDEF)-like protein